jgi:hypothetical protein
LQQLALQRGVSVSSAQSATILLHIRPYKITVVPEIKPVDYEKEWGSVIGISIMCLTDFSILS